MAALLPISALEWTSAPQWTDESVEQCKIQIREMVHALKADIGSMRAVGRYHQEGTRRLESDYAVKDRVLGVGINGGVRLATGRSSRRNARFAIKSFDLKKIVEKRAEAQLLSELQIHMTVDHPHIVKLVDIYEAYCELHVVMECMDGGELFDRMLDRKIFLNEEAAQTIRQILLAVAYLHDQDIVHRDVKPENFLFESREGSHLKLTDFGFSTFWGDGDANLQMSCGTASYAAPEVFNRSYTKQCDLWSVGVIAFALLGGYFPFGGERPQMISHIKACRFKMFEERWGSVSENAHSFVLALLRTEDQQRLTAREALEHPWLLEGSYSRQQFPAIHGSIFQALCNFQQTSRLLRACCCIASLSPCVNPMGEDLRAFFLNMDCLGTGFVKLEDFKQALAGRSEKVDQNGELLENVFHALDRDGCIQYSEFLAVMELSSGQLSRGSIADVFRRFDADNSGYITKSNLQDLLGCNSEDDPCVQDLLKELHLDKVSSVRFSAFEACLTQVPETKQEELGGKQQSQSWQQITSYLKTVISRLGRHGEDMQPYRAPDPAMVGLECGWVMS